MKWQGAAAFRQYLDTHEDFLNKLVENITNKAQIASISIKEDEIEKIEEEDKEVAKQMAEIEAETAQEVEQEKKKTKKDK